MNGWWSDDVTAIAAQIDPLRQPSTIPDETTGVGEIDVTAAAPGDRLYCGREWPEPMLKPLERGVTAVFRIDVKYNQVRNLACDDANICIRPTPVPISDVVLGRSFMLQMVPTDERPLIAWTQR
jgi:hypothetical protein